MRDRDEFDALARAIDDRLQALAPPRAPASLLARVMTATVHRPAGVRGLPEASVRLSVNLTS